MHGKTHNVPHIKEPIHVLKVKMTRYGAGKGLFAGEFIKKGDFVIEYTGKRLPNSKADYLGTRYLFDLENGYTLDGSVKWNLARWINHACTPNVEAELDEDQGRVFIHAVRDIMPNEELTIDYGENYFDDFIRSKGCRCKECVEEREEAPAK